MRCNALTDFSFYPPPETGRRGPVFPHDYISKRWLPGPGGNIPGFQNWQEAFRKVYISEGQRKNLQLQVF